MPLKTDAARQLLDYHERTKHHLHRYARSAGYMDWDNQPSPFRTYDGARTIPLPLTDRDPAIPYASLYRPIAGAAFPLDIAAFGTLLEFSLALSAWKAIPGHRWALRINPSSGNLHPTEAHWIAVGVAGLPDGLYHYHPLTHALEERARLAPAQVGDLKAYLAPPCLLMMLSSIYWRESWKYGERAFRYCQHDVGHALAAVRLAARLLGWRLVVLEAADTDVASAFGFDRTPWPPGDAEDPALLAAVFPAPSSLPRRDFPPEAALALAAMAVAGRPNRLSPRHRDWTIITRAAEAGRRTHLAAPSTHRLDPLPVAHPAPSRPSAAAVIRQRRSAQAFDPEGTLDREAFFGMLDRTLPRAACAPFDTDIGPARISLVLFVHRVHQVPPGLYALVRHPDHRVGLEQALADAFKWETVASDLPLYLLEPGDVRAEAIDLSCRQEIGGFSTFSLGMLAQFEPVVRENPWCYRQLFWETGMIGQVLYLEAEAWGLRGTGIGCYFDDPVHERIGLKDRSWQSLYHFTVGFPLEDKRLQTLPPYYHLDPERKRPHE